MICAAATRAASISASLNAWQAPRKVCIVRCPSGVTRIRQRALAGAVRRGPGLEIDLRGTDIVRKHVAKVIVLHLADESRARAEPGGADDRIGGRAAGDDDGLTHRLIELFRRRFVDQRHAALVEAVGKEKIVVAWSEDIDDGIADAENFEAGFGHGG